VVSVSGGSGVGGAAPDPAESAPFGSLPGALSRPLPGPLPRPAPRPWSGVLAGPLFDPCSVAVVGACEDPAKWGYWLASGALDGRHRRTVHLVNRRGGELRGVRFAPSLAQLRDPSGPPEHIVIATPHEYVREVVEQGLALDARCFTVIASGSAPEEEQQIAALIRSAGARLLGPNCMGVVDTGTELRLSWGDFPAGRVGLVSQSGNLGLEIGRLLARVGEGFSRFVSLGNQRDIDAADAMETLLDHTNTKVIAAYVEDFRDGRRLARVLAAARAAAKPVLLLTVGRSPAAARTAASHTGALVSALATVEAVCRDTGALLVASAGEAADLAAAAQTLAALCQAAVDHPELAVLELNPLLAHPGGAVALDANGVLA
jgi:acetate---CoA ligase (ADP-forming)